MKARKLFSVLTATVVTALVARAEVSEEPLLSPADENDVWGKKITGLGDSGDETALVFTKTGVTMNWTLPDGVKSIWYLVVGGGGSGGSSYADSNSGGGGGGAGGMLESKNVSITSGDISVTVGKGGDAVTATSNSNAARPAGNVGDNSSLTVDGVAITAHGGGGGGGCGSKAGKIGGSGGGAYANNTVGACYDGEGYPGGQGTGTKCGGGGGGGGGAGGEGGSTSDASGGKGGPGKISLIGGGYVALVKDDSGNDYYCAGGGGGSGGIRSGGAGGVGGGGKGNAYSTNATTSDSGSNFGCGGGGTQGNQWKHHTSGAGYQGVVVVRYRVLAGNVVEVPGIASAEYNGELQKAEVPLDDGYTVTKNEGGVNAGDYEVILTLVDGYRWYGGSAEPAHLTFTIAKAANAWTTEPSLSRTTWELDENPATVSAGAALSGTEVLVTYDEGDTVMPLSVGAHRAIFMVTESQNYLELAKTVDYTISKNTNVWTVEPSLTKTTWAFDEEPGEIVDGEAKYGDVDVIYDDDRSLVELPTDLGEHTVKFAVAGTDTYTGLEKVVNYTVTKKQHKWTVPPSVPATVNIEDGVSFPMPAAEQGVEVAVYFDNDPEKTELTEIALGETHTVTYTIEGDDDWDKVEQTFTFKGVYKAIVDQSDPSKVFGYRIPKLGVNQDEVALVFTNTSAAMTYKLPSAVSAVSYLVVGGGGGGGGWVGSYACGGGGAGGVVSNLDVAVSGGSISVVVGKGGAGCTSSSHNARSGAASQLVLGAQPAVIAYGGGKGGCGEAGVGGEGYGSGGGGGSTLKNSKYTSLAGGAANPDGQGHAGGAGFSGTYRGGGGGGAGEDGWTPTSEQSGKGGDGIVSDITGDDVWYAGGGGGGSQTNGGIASPGGKGGGGAGGSCASNQMTAGRDATYFGGGGGSAKGNANGGSGYQGVVIVRYVEPAGVVMVPYIAPKSYTGETLVADVPANVGYTVTENAGGTDVGEYAVVLTLNEGYHWDGGSTSPEYLAFAITPARNEWMVEPSITKATWLTTDDPGELTSGETKFGSPTATITKDGGDAESFDGTLPTAAGRYVVVYTVETSDNWIDPEVTEKSVGFEIVSGDVVPPFTVTRGETTTVVGDGKVDLSVGYAVHCEVESDKKVDIYAYYAEDGADTTNEVKIAEGVALDATGTGVIADLKPGVTYWVALGGKGGDTVAPTTEFATVTVAGPATGLAAAATFTNDPKEFVITGSVVPGLGTTTVYLRWSLNSDALDNLATYTFAYGEAGTFVKRVQYVDPTDTLTWDVAVSNSFMSTTHGDLTWDDALPASTKKRTDTVATVYTWTGAGENNDWANPENWLADNVECFGYPDNEDYAKAKITRTVTINLGGKTFKVVKGEALILDANSGDVVTLTNGTLRAEYDGDGDFGAPGTTVVFRDATLNRTRLNPTTKGGMTTIFEGNSKLTGMVRPWNATDAKIIFRNGDITIGGNFGNGGAKSGTEVIISNATVTVQGEATKSWGPGTFPVKLQNGPDRQARIVHTESHGFDFVQSPYTLAIPAEPYAMPYLQALKPLKVIETSPVFNIDVTNWKHGKRVPILTFTQSASGVTEQYGNATLRAYENGVDVTEERHARLEWNATKRTLYYKQDGQFGMMIHVR